MNITFIKSTLLKWLFLPVIICVRLIVIPIEGLILYIRFAEEFLFYYGIRELNQKTNTIVGYKVRMNN